MTRVTEPVVVTLLDRIGSVLEKLEHEAYMDFIEHVLSANRIFVVGAGRSGLVGKFFVMRLVHLGKQAFIVGETNTPSISEGDLLVAISGSGHTSSVLNVAKSAKEHGAWVVTITANHQSPLHEFADDFVQLERRIDVKARKEFSARVQHGLNIMPMGTLFELSTLVYLEAVTGEIIIKCKIHEEEMKQRHSNLE